MISFSSASLLTTLIPRWSILQHTVAWLNHSARHHQRGGGGGGGGGTDLVSLSCCSRLALSSGNVRSNCSLLFKSRLLHTHGASHDPQAPHTTHTQAYHLFLALFSILCTLFSQSAICESNCAHSLSSLWCRASLPRLKCCSSRGRSRACLQHTHKVKGQSLKFLQVMCMAVYMYVAAAAYCHLSMMSL